MVTRNSRVAGARNLKMKYFSEASVLYMFLMWMREKREGEREREKTEMFYLTFLSVAKIR